MAARLFAVLLALLPLAGGAWALSPAPPIPLAIGLFPVRAKLAVASPAFKPGGPIPTANSGYGDNRFPGLSWSAGPRGTRAYVVIVQDGDPPDAAVGTVVHWIAFNIPANVQNLPPGADLPASARQGRTYIERIGYAGPRPPPGPPHRYHFHVFALDRPLDLGDGADFQRLQQAMRGRVLAAGELVGTYRFRGSWR